MTAVIQPGLRDDPAVTRHLTINVGYGDTDRPGCRTLPLSDYGEDSFYHAPRHALSVAVLPETGERYEMGCSTVARQNARYAAKLGYTYQLIDRADWEDDMHELRSSAPIRQGREMPDAYMTRQSYGSDAWPADPCMRHLITVHGVTGPDGHLAGYCQMVQCGDVARVNSILGHWDHLPDRIMWLLMLELVRWHIDECAARYALYYTHLSGHGPGLRYWKERLGFRPSRVTWEW